MEQMAWAMDQMQKLTMHLLESYLRMEALDAAEGEVTITLTQKDMPLTYEKARIIKEWVDGDDMQDLRRWAEEVKGAEPVGEIYDDEPG